ncbi:mite allergen Der p 3-like isoform X2 [Contarinia nasturtii]|nr:mite allergen Der p 3-like isoform X2 [Contarinia nasturtii]
MGGDIEDIENSPYSVVCMEKLEDSDQYFGGSIITKNLILTAAHSLHKANLNFLKCYVGSSVLLKGKEVEIAELIVHPFYQYPIQQFDIAIIRLKDKLTFENKNIQPIALPDKNDRIRNGELCTITGFGFRGIKELPVSLTLRSLKLHVLSYKKCNQLYPNRSLPYTICTIHRQLGKDACEGDSGGAVTCTNAHGKRIIYGVIMSGVECKPFGEPMLHLPGISTNVVKFIDWIQSVISENIHDKPFHAEPSHAELRIHSAPYSFWNADDFEQDDGHSGFNPVVEREGTVHHQPQVAVAHAAPIAVAHSPAIALSHGQISHQSYSSPVIAHQPEVQQQHVLQQPALAGYASQGYAGHGNAGHASGYSTISQVTHHGHGGYHQ